MSDTNEAGGFAAAGSGKSEAEVAFDLLSKLKGQGVWGERNATAILDMYAECLDAAKGLRSYEGQNRVEVPINSAEPKRTAQAAPQTAAPQPVQAQMTQAPIAPPQQPAPVQVQQPILAQPVHTQQQQLQQAYKQG